MHRAHAVSIPFENLDPHCGRHVSLAIEDLEHKLVVSRRGGYCFEQNVLLKAALEALGAQVEPILARVRAGAPPGTIRPRSHLVLRVRAEGELWLADVGFGRGTLLEPLRFGPGAAHEQSGWGLRVIQDGPELVLQTAAGDAWVDAYGFVPEPAPFVDIEVSNWFTTAHPRSPFVTGLIACRHHDDGTRTVLSDWDGLVLSRQTPAASTATAVSWDAVPELLATHFGLEGFELHEGGRRLAPAGGCGS
ncbi:MAG: arylamine N-acetyltransferase [Solirubrobacteraceae bacterium]